MDSRRGLALAHRADERFPMCSTFKLLASGAVLQLVDEGKESLDRTIRYGPGDLLEYAPVTKARVGEGGMRLDDICAAAIDWSDNTAANLILSVIGGPRDLRASRARSAMGRPGSTAMSRASTRRFLEIRAIRQRRSPWRATSRR